jgi:hypothetical protein
MIQYVDNTVCTKSPWSPVTWITYEPGRTFPIMKPPLATPVPSWIAHAALPGKTTLGDEGLETLQVLLVGRRPVTWTEIHLPAWTLLSVTLAAKINNTLKSNAEALTCRLLRITSTSCPVLTTSCSYYNQYERLFSFVIWSNDTIQWYWRYNPQSPRTLSRLISENNKQAGGGLSLDWGLVSLNEPLLSAVSTN